MITILAMQSVNPSIVCRQHKPLTNKHAKRKNYRIVPEAEAH